MTGALFMAGWPPNKNRDRTQRSDPDSFGSRRHRSIDCATDNRPGVLQGFSLLSRRALAFSASPLAS